MLRKDYILRHLEEFGKMMALILSLKKNNDWEKFEKEIADAAMKFSSLDIAGIEILNSDEFETRVILEKNISQEQKTMLATLLFEKMNYYVVLEDGEKVSRLKSHCLKLYQHVRDNFTENEFNLDVHYKLEFLGKMDN